jgi:pimeloyl-ACP methyl ester carboxylesterase
VKPWRLILLALLAAVLASFVVFWPWIDAQRRAVVVLATVVETPVLTWAVKVVTAEPKVEEAVIAGNATTLVHPPGDGPWPAIVFVNGATPEGRRQRDVQRLAHGLARAGFLVLVPDIPGLARGELSEQTLSATVDVAFAATRRSDVREGRIGLVGVSVGGSLALLAAADPLLAGRVTSVAAFAPYATLPSVLRLATTGYYLDEGTLKPYDADPFLALVVARSLIVALPVGIDRSRLYSVLAQVQPDAQEPLAALRTFDEAELAPPGRAVLRLLTNTRPTAFESLYAQLSPGLRAQLGRLSPLVTAVRVDVPVELLTAPNDKYFPVTESRALVTALPKATLTVTPASGRHVIPRPSLSHPIGLLQFNAFAVRALKSAG